MLRYRLRSRPLQRLGLLLSLAGALVSACSPATSVEHLPDSDVVLLQARRRIGSRLSITEADQLRDRGDRVLALLSAYERYALGRNYIRIRQDTAADVSIAAPLGSEPFWLADQGFVRVAGDLETTEGTYSIHRKRFGPGWVGLGINSLDRRASDHYLIFIHSESGATPRQLNPALDDFPTRVERSTRFRRSLRSLPKDLRDAYVIAPETRRRHDSAFLVDRPWKTRVPSSRKPDQIVVSPGADAATELAWNWRTLPEVPGGVVELVDGDARRLISADSILVESYGLLNDPIVRRHRARVAGLRPNTLYTYRVGDGSPAGWSAPRSVRTGPEVGHSFEIMYLGDAQCGLEGWGDLLKAAVARRPDLRAILLAGDLVDRGNERSNWDHFFLRAAGVVDRIPFLPAVGNHEYLDRGPVHYSASFTLPANGPPQIDPGLAYRVDLGSLRLIVLDSNLGKYDARSATVQGTWMKEQFQASSASWRVVMFHHPVHASHPTRENPELARTWAPLFEECGVDLVLQGHDHAYLRTYPMRGATASIEPTSPDQRPPIYVVSVSGEKFSPQGVRPYAARAFAEKSTVQFLSIDAAKGTLTYSALDARGAEVDRFVLERRSPLNHP